MSTDQLENRFAKILASSDDALRLCIVAILSWIASSDGEVDKEEKSMLEQLATDSERHTRVAIDVGHRGEPEGLRLACRVVPQISAEQRELLLVLALGMCLADGYLKPSETHILLFLCDLTGIGYKRLNVLFRETTGEDMPVLSDLSSAQWWHGRQAHSPATTRKERIESLAVLGLDVNATQDEITAAYFRLASIHHPDRFASLGPEAVDAASHTFRRIKNAYDSLARP